MTDDTENNMRVWSQVETTDPDDTKEVNFGRKFTAIDPYSQIKRATEVFGVAGQDWGWSVERVDYLPTDQAAVLVRLWFKASGNEKAVEQWGQSGLFTDNAKSKVDNDCMKKATTDGITKCLSYLGFNADVFLGKFDDNKYVAEQKANQSGKNGFGDGTKPPESAWGGPLAKQKFKDAMREFNTDLLACEDMDSLTALLAVKETVDLLNQCQRDMPSWWTTQQGSDAQGFSERIDARKNELKQKEAA